MSAEQTVRKFQKELNAGAVSLVLLNVIHQHQEPMYGYEIARELEQLAHGALPMNQAAIYPVLRSLEKQGLLRSRQVPSSSGPPRKYYQLTAAGKRAMDDWRKVWDVTTNFVESVLERDNAETAHSRHQIPRHA